MFSNIEIIAVADWKKNGLVSEYDFQLCRSTFETKFFFSEDAKFARALRRPFSLVNVETNFVISTYVQALVC